MDIHSLMHTTVCARRAVVYPTQMHIPGANCTYGLRIDSGEGARTDQPGKDPWSIWLNAHRAAFSRTVVM